jgi:hypothetical protein
MVLASCHPPTTKAISSFCRDSGPERLHVSTNRLPGVSREHGGQGSRTRIDPHPRLPPDTGADTLGHHLPPQVTQLHTVVSADLNSARIGRPVPHTADRQWRPEPALCSRGDGLGQPPTTPVPTARDEFSAQLSGRTDAVPPARPPRGPGLTSRDGLSAVGRHGVQPVGEPVDCPRPAGTRAAS